MKIRSAANQRRTIATDELAQPPDQRTSWHRTAWLRAASARCIPLLIGLCCLVPFRGLLVPDYRGIPDNPWINCDYGSFQLPIRELAASELRSGRFPLWSPLLACGTPLHATQQGSFCHPLVTPLIALCGAAYGLKLCIFIHLAITYSGSYLFARSLDVSRASSSFAALVTTWAGFGITHLMAGHVTIVIEYALMPWFFLALGRLLRDPGALSAAAVSAVIACFFLSGQPQIAYYTLVCGFLWTVCAVIWGAARTHRWRSTRWAIVAVAVAILLAAVQLLPAAELARDGLSSSNRGTFDYAAMHSLDGIDLLRLLAPYLLGNPFWGPPPIVLGDAYHERIAYVGVLAPALAFFGLSRVTAARWQWGATFLVLACVTISLGRHTPLFQLVEAIVPGAALFRCPGRILCVADVLVPVLAARGLDGLAHRDAGASPRAQAGVLFVLCLVASITAYALLFAPTAMDLQALAAHLGKHLADEIVITAFIVIGTGAVAAAALRQWIAPVFVQGAAIGIALADLGYFNVQNFELRGLRRVEPPASLIRRNCVRFVGAPQFPALTRGSLQYSDLVPTAVSARWQLVGTDEGGVMASSTERLFCAIQKNPSTALAVASCEYAFQPPALWHPLRSPLPRARLVSESNAHLLDIPIEDLDDKHMLLLQDRHVRNVRLVEDTAQRVALDVEAQSAGFLVLADTCYPGWKVMVDGNAAEISIAHHVFRSVRIPAGRHHAIFIYEPSSFRFGLAGSLTGLIVWCALAACALRRCGAFGCRPLRIALAPSRTFPEVRAVPS